MRHQDSTKIVCKDDPGTGSFAAHGHPPTCRVGGADLRTIRALLSADCQSSPAFGGEF